MDTSTSTSVITIIPDPDQLSAISASIKGIETKLSEKTKRSMISITESISITD